MLTWLHHGDRSKKEDKVFSAKPNQLNSKHENLTLNRKYLNSASPCMDFLYIWAQEALTRIIFFDQTDLLAKA